MELSEEVQKIFEKAEMNALHSGTNTTKTIAMVLALKGVAMALAENTAYVRASNAIIGGDAFKLTPNALIESDIK